VFVAYVMVTEGGASVYTDPPKITPEVAAHLQEAGVEVGSLRARAGARARTINPMPGLLRPQLPPACLPACLPRGALHILRPTALHRP
jgi:hypothetical protein